MDIAPHQCAFCHKSCIGRYGLNQHTAAFHDTLFTSSNNRPSKKSRNETDRKQQMQQKRQLELDQLGLSMEQYNALREKYKKPKKYGLQASGWGFCKHCDTKHNDAQNCTMTSNQIKGSYQNENRRRSIQDYKYLLSENFVFKHIFYNETMYTPMKSPSHLIVTPQVTINCNGKDKILNCVEIALGSVGIEGSGVRDIKTENDLTSFFAHHTEYDVIPIIELMGNDRRSEIHARPPMVFALKDKGIFILIGITESNPLEKHMYSLDTYRGIIHCGNATWYNYKTSEIKNFKDCARISQAIKLNKLQSVYLIICKGATPSPPDKSNYLLKDLPDDLHWRSVGKK